MRRVLILSLLLATTGCVEEIKESRVKSALLDGGVPEPMAGCMAHQMAKKLTVGQLRSLQKIAGPKRSMSEYIDALRKHGDVEALEVTASSAAMCKLGIIR